MALILVFAGFCFSVATLGDCKFAVIDDGFISLSNAFPIFNDDENALRRGVGFITFEKPGGGCYYYDNNLVNQEDLVRTYIDWLGNGWNVGRALAATTPAMSFLVWMYLWSFVCTAQVRACRYTVAGILCVVLTTLQGCTFTALTSSFCDENGCKFSRSSGWSLGALLCFFFSGLGLLFTWNYPGDQVGPAVASKGEEVPEEDEEDPEQAIVAEEDAEEKEDADKDEQDEEAPEEQAPAQDEEVSDENVEVLPDAAGVEKSTEMEVEA